MLPIWLLEFHPQSPLALLQVLVLRLVCVESLAVPSWPGPADFAPEPPQVRPRGRLPMPGGPLCIGDQPHVCVRVPLPGGGPHVGPLGALVPFHVHGHGDGW